MFMGGDLFQGLFDVFLGVVSAETKKNGDDGTSKSRQHWGLRSVAFHLQNCGRRPRVGQRLGLSFGIYNCGDGNPFLRRDSILTRKITNLFGQLNY